MDQGSSGGKKSRPPTPEGLSFSGRSSTSSDSSKSERSAPPSRLGAGGTSVAGAEAKHQAGDNRKPGPKEEPKSRAGLKASLATASIPAAVLAMNILLMVLIGKLLKGMMLAAMAAAVNFWNAMLGLLISLVKQAGALLLGAGAAVAGAVGGFFSAATGAMGVVGVGSAAVAMVAGAIVTNNVAEETMRADGQINCQPVVERTIADVETSDGAISAAENAEIIYSVLAAWGMPDENIAGMLGNWDAESTIDATGVETVSSEPHRIGTLKQQAWDADWSIAEFNPAYAAKFPAIDKMGIGLGQWTNGRNDLLMEYADSTGRDWHELETQLGFMVSADDPARVAYIKSSIEKSRGSVEDATLSFMKDWEGISDASTGKRLDAAEHWMAMFGAWEVNESLADSILDQSGTTVDDANKARAAEVRSTCQDSADAVAAGDSDYSGSISAEGWAEPTETMYVTSLWGPRNHPGTGTCRSHGGLDLDGNEGDPYFAAHDGTVTDAKWEVGGGFTLTIKLSDGSGFIKYLHTHASSNSPSGVPEFFVKPGDVVKAGDHVGNIGNTGASFGAHLHFEIHETDSVWVGWPQGWSGWINPKTFYEDQGFTFAGIKGTANSCS